MAAMRRSVVRLPDGAILLRLGENERSIVRALVDDLRAIIGEETPTPGVWEADADDEVEDGEQRGEDDAPGARSEPPVQPDPVVARLYPDARPDDPTWSAGFRDLTRRDLDDGRRENVAIVEETLEARSLDDAQAEAWLHVLNDIRLVLGTRLGVTEEDEQAPLDPDDPDAAGRIVFAYAGYLEAQFVDVLSEALPDVADDGRAAMDPGEDEDDADADADDERDERDEREGA